MLIFQLAEHQQVLRVLLKAGPDKRREMAPLLSNGDQNRLPT